MKAPRAPIQGATTGYAQPMLKANPRARLSVIPECCMMTAMATMEAMLTLEDMTRFTMPVSMRRGAPFSYRPARL